MFFCVSALWGLTFWLTGLPAVTIDTVEVVGVVSMSPSAVASSTHNYLSGRYWFTVPRANILFYPKHPITDDILRAYPRSESVEVKFKNFHTITVAVVEREAVALWCRPVLAPEVRLGEKWDDCYLLDKNAFVFDRFDPSLVSSPDVMRYIASSRSPVFVKFYGGFSESDVVGQTYSSVKNFHDLLSLATRVAPLGVTVLSYRERPDHDLDVELLGGAHLVINREPEVSVIADNLRAIISELNFGNAEGLNKIDYIDMRFGNKLFYKHK